MSDLKLLNVRLTAQDERHVRVLKAHGLSLTQVVRDALRERAQALHTAQPDDTEALIEQMLQLFPAPSPTPARPTLDTTDRRAFAQFIRQRLQAKQPIRTARRQRKAKRKTG